MEDYMMALMGLLVFIFASRYLSEVATQKLPSDKKAELIDLFSGGRTLRFGLLILIIGLYFFVVSNRVIPLEIAWISYTVIILLYWITNVYWDYTKLKSHEFPFPFVRSYLLSSGLRLAGILLFLGILIN